MSNRTLQVDDALYAYLQAKSVREHPVLARLRATTAELGRYKNMQIAPEQGQLMALLVKLIGAKNLLEVGTFTGYSALACALALPADGQLIACDVSETWTAIGQPFWHEAGVADRISLRLGPAVETLQGLLRAGKANAFDFMFIDADKSSYDAYYELGLQLVRPNGLILIDNTLWGGDVADERIQDEDTVAIRALNEKLLHDERVDISLIPIGDGLTVVRRR